MYLIRGVRVGSGVIADIVGFWVGSGGAWVSAAAGASVAAGPGAAGAQEARKVIKPRRKKMRRKRIGFFMAG